MRGLFYEPRPSIQIVDDGGWVHCLTSNRVIEIKTGRIVRMGEDLFCTVHDHPRLAKMIDEIFGMSTGIEGIEFDDVIRGTPSPDKTRSIIHDDTVALVIKAPKKRKKSGKKKV